MEKMVSSKLTACGSCCTTEPVSADYKGKTFYFCEQECKDEFLMDPEAFIKSDHFLIELETKEN